MLFTLLNVTYFFLWYEMKLCDCKMIKMAHAHIILILIFDQNIPRNLLTTLVKIPQWNRFDSSLTTYYLLNEHKVSWQLFYVNSEFANAKKSKSNISQDNYDLNLILNQCYLHASLCKTSTINFKNTGILLYIFDKYYNWILRN